MIAVDTNVFVHAANHSSPSHSASVALVRTLAASPAPWCSTWNMLYEFLRVTTHHKILPRPLSLTDAHGFIDRIVAVGNFHVLSATTRHADILQQTVRELPEVRGNLVFDLHTAVLLREHGVARIYTYDGDFRRFPFLDVQVPSSST
jgi:uncharacterized protein